jgi:Ca2+-binding EF-hand superfamily protein
MDLEMKCPHCDQWTASNIESCSKCGGHLFESTQGANPFISSLKDNWKLATGLTGAVLIFSVLFLRPNPTPPPGRQAQNLPPEKQKEPPSQKPNLPTEKPKQQKPDLSGQLGFYGQWDKDKDGYLKGTEIVAALTELNNVEVNVIDPSGESRVVKFRWEPPRDIDLDQRLSKEELTHRNRGYFLLQEYDLDKDGLLSKAEIEKVSSAVDITGTPRKQLLFEPLKKFDLNQDGKLALLEIPPYHSIVAPRKMAGTRPGGRDSGSRTQSARQIAEWRKKWKNVSAGTISRRSTVL